MAGKRSNGDGAVKKLPSGTWRGQIMDGYRDDGKRNILSFTGKTKGEVLDKIRNYWRQKEQNPELLNQDLPFHAWADTWYAEFRGQVQPSTYANYAFTLKILKEHFGEMKLREIKPLHIKRFYDQMAAQGCSQSYITKFRSMLIQIFDEAENNDLVLKNPARKAKGAKVNDEVFQEAQEGGKDAYSDTELELLRKGLPDNVVGHSILLMLGTGMRSQELLALMPQDIAEDGSSVSVTKAIKMVGGVPKLGPPKSKRGRRMIPVPMDYRVDACYLRQHSGKPYIWTSKREDGLFDVGAFRKRYYRTIGKVPGVRKLSPHCCKHTYISNLEKRGVPMEQIARLVGHSRISTTDGYLHTDIQTLSNAVAVLND